MAQTERSTIDIFPSLRGKNETVLMLFYISNAYNFRDFLRFPLKQLLFKQIYVVFEVAQFSMSYNYYLSTENNFCEIIGTFGAIMPQFKKLWRYLTNNILLAFST